MTAFRRLGRVLATASQGSLFFFCPGCKYVHGIQYGPGPGQRWTWTGSADEPTFTPSILVKTGPAVDPSFKWEEGDPPPVCHSFVTKGRIQFLGDCSHELAGQTVDLPEWNEA